MVDKFDKIMNLIVAGVFVLGGLAIVYSAKKSRATQKVARSQAAKQISYELQLSNKPITGTVLSEKYENTLSSVLEYHKEKQTSGLVSQSNAIAHSNETVKVDSKYTLKVKTDDGKILGVSVVDGGDVTKESLDAIVNQGSRISFPRGNIKSGSIREDYIQRRENSPRFEAIKIRNQVHLDAYEETYFRPNTQAGTKRADRIRVLDNALAQSQ